MENSVLSTVHEHLFNGKNNVHIYELKVQANGLAYFRGNIPNFNDGDLLKDSRGRFFKFNKIISRCDSKGKYENPVDGINSLICAELEQCDNPNSSVENK